MERDECMDFIEDTNNTVRRNKTNSWKALLRQSFICTGVWCTHLIQGMYLGAPTVLIAQIRRDVNNTEILTDEMASWITSAPVICAVPFALTLPWLFGKMGRKFTFLIVWFSLTIGVIVFYVSTNLYHVLISEVAFGASTGAVLTFTPVVITEYTSPKYRGIFLTLKSATTFWGIWISNAIGTFFHWKNIGLVSVVFPIYVMITVFLWPESPYWLAENGRYEECAKSHRWLKGCNKNSEKELRQLVRSTKKSKNIPDSSQPNDTQIISRCSRIWMKMKSRPFSKPILICLALHALYQFSGKMVISLYAIQILKRLTDNDADAYKEMLILDGVTVFSMYAGCILSRYFKRRILLILFSGISILLLYILSLYLYLIYLSILNENQTVILLLLTTFSIAIGSGPMILATSICGELLPLRYQYIGLLIVGLGAITLTSILLKSFPFMLKTLQFHGLFLFFAIFSSMFLLVLYIHLPETKDKTKYEIDVHFKGNQTEIEHCEAFAQLQ